MKVCGFTFVRNAIKYGYPIVKSTNWNCINIYGFFPVSYIITFL